MIDRLGWPLVLLGAAIAFTFGSTIALAVDGDLWAILSTAGLTVAIFCAMLAAFHRGRASAFGESAEMAREFERARKAKQDNGGR